MKIFVTGGSGFIGQYIVRFFSAKNNVLYQYFNTKVKLNNATSVKSDITDFSLTEKIINEFKPEVIIHTAAISNSKIASEISKEKLNLINVKSTENLARISNKINAKLIFFSTDLVYDGNSDNLKKETDRTNPISDYAKSKLKAEEVLIENSENYLILRIALHYGLGLNGRSCHFSEMLENLIAGKKVKLFYDQFRTPVSVAETPRMIFELIESGAKNETFNFGGKESVSRYQLGLLTAEICKLNKNLIIKSSLEESNLTEKVKNVSLNTEKLINAGVKIKTLENSIKTICRKIKQL